MKRFSPGLVCDVGALDGSESVLFQPILPHARMIAFEANPRNFGVMRDDPRLEAHRIEVVNRAVSDKAVTISFHVETLGEGANGQWRRGASSIHERVAGSIASEARKIAAIRLDEYLGSEKSLPEIALWVGVEGGAYDVLRGIDGIKDKVQMVHVEVETKEIWSGQKLEKDVDTLMPFMGFVKIAQGHFTPQHDVVCVRSGILRDPPRGLNKVLRTARVLSWIKKGGDG